MTAILVVCTGNICRSPIAEGQLRDALAARFGDLAPAVSSAGIMGWEGSPAQPESVQAAAERGVDISSHVARLITTALIEQADLVVGMAPEHREAVATLDPEAVDKTFTLKELVRLLEQTPQAAVATDPHHLVERAAEASGLRQGGFVGNPQDDAVADPLGMPITSYRAIAWELEGWIGRLVDGLYGSVPEAAEG